MPRVPFLVSVFVVTTAGCSSPAAPAFPDSISYRSQTLTKTASWTRGNISGIVYVPAGEQLPSAPLQIGVIVSTEHASAALLHEWVQQQFTQSGVLPMHQSGSDEASCKAANDGRRIFTALDVCKTGVARAACVEADEELDERTFTSCLTSPGCFQSVCDRRWSEHREPLDLLAADVLSRR